VERLDRHQSFEFTQNLSVGEDRRNVAAASEDNAVADAGESITA